MKPQEIRDLSPEEIQRKLKEAKENLFKLEMKFTTKQIENTAQLKVIKRDIARMMTILKQKKLGKEAVNVGKK
ncbi:MAG: 50S ribosomal protein L29 [bacterium]